VTTGFGRAGTLTVTGRMGLTPDMLILSKGITAGYMPLAAIAVTAEIARIATNVSTVFHHGSTADGHPLAMAAANAVLDELVDGGVLDNVQDRGAELAEAIRSHAPRAVVKVHGRGLMIAADLADEFGTPLDADDMHRMKVACQRHGLLVSICANMILLTPPLVVTRAEAEQMANRLCTAVTEVTEARQLT
jgi:adenosylmethionine-8-amino-7-oxononanoate aminotransferase